MYQGKTVLITGGTGSFGHAVLDVFLKTEIKEIRIFSRDELKQEEMRKKYRNNKIKFYIGDVKDIDSLNFAMVSVDYVFHAAALKQVPSCEFFPIEAVKTNIIGTENVILSAIANHVEKVICLSTDKAVYPINAMGISKAMMERVAIAKSKPINGIKTSICVTRFGNVMASRGSVIPLFVNQIKVKEPLTITNKEMTRFLMSLDEAVKLVFFALENGKTGDTFVQKSPACTIDDLTTALCEVFGVEKNIRLIGIRHGEKLYETLLTKEEYAKAIDMGDFYCIPSDKRDLNYDLYFEQGNIKHSHNIDYNSNNTNQLSIKEIKDKLLSIPYIQDQLINWSH